MKREKKNSFDFSPPPALKKLILSLFSFSKSSDFLRVNKQHSARP